MPTVKLERIADIQGGYQAKKEMIKTAQGSHFLIQSKDFDSHKNLLTETLMSFLPERKPEIYSVHKGDVLFQARGMSHFAYYVKENLENALASSSFYILRVKSDKLLPEYLAWRLNQKDAQNYFKANACGGGISFISKKVLSEMKIHIPPVSIQKKVSKIAMLNNRVEFLQKRLSSLRTQFTNAVCMKAIQKQESKP